MSGTPLPLIEAWLLMRFHIRKVRKDGIKSAFQHVDVSCNDIVWRRPRLDILARHVFEGVIGSELTDPPSEHGSKTLRVVRVLARSERAVLGPHPSCC